MISKNLNIKSSIFNSSSESLEGSNAPGLFLISPESCEVFQKVFFDRKESLSSRPATQLEPELKPGA